ncbi:MAG: hypothetical protein AAF533_08815 [Acidobacteriota bacterium]
MDRKLVNSLMQLLGALAVLGLVPVGAWAQGECAELVVVDRTDSVGEPTGSIFDVDLDEALPDSVQPLGLAGPVGRRTDLALADGRRLFVLDAEMDPAGLGPDPAGGSGPGGVLGLDLMSGDLRVLADGTTCEASLDCSVEAPALFVEPTGLAWWPGTELLVVADPEADPLGLGPDRLGGSGHGAIYSVSIATGEVALISAGDVHSESLPDGRPIFEDPIAVTFDEAGVLHVLDRSALRPSDTHRGIWFTVNVATGRASLANVPSEPADLRDLALGPTDAWLLGGGTGGLAPGIWSMGMMGPLELTPIPELVDPVSLTVAGARRLLVLDAMASLDADGDTVADDLDGDGLPDHPDGVIWEVDMDTRVATQVGWHPDFRQPVAVARLDPILLESAVPPMARRGENLTVTLVGGPYVVGATVDFGPGVNVRAVRVLDSRHVEVELTVEPGTELGGRDIRVTNPDRTQAFHCDLFEITGGAGCAASVLASPVLLHRESASVLRVSWESSEDPCRLGHRLYRGDAVRPTSGRGRWPEDPVFMDITDDDRDGATEDPGLSVPLRDGLDSYFLVVPVGSDGTEQTAGHYSP